MTRFGLGVLAVALASCAAPQRGAPPPTLAWSGPDTVTFPLSTFTWNGRLFFFVVELSVNGERGLFVMDSGSNTTLFTDRFTHALDAQVSGTRNGVVYGVGGADKTKAIVYDSIDFGFARVSNLSVSSGDVLKALNRPLIAQRMRPLAGLIGVDVLVPLGASIDLANATITFRRTPGRPPAPVPAAGAPSPAGR